MKTFSISVLFASVIMAATAQAYATDNADIATHLNEALFSSDTLSQTHENTLPVYALHAYQPIWWQDSAWREETEDAVAWLEETDALGLDQERYGAQQFNGLFEPGYSAGFGAQEIAEIELALTQALLFYADDQRRTALSLQRLIGLL